MHFLIADTFTASLVRLTNDEQKAVKTTAFDLQMNPAQPGMKFHRLDRAKDPNFWSVRVSRDIRLIVHRTDDSLLLCYAGHHDEAYRWAERRKLETHPKTGAAQLVEIRETVREIAIPKYVEVERPKPALLIQISDEELLNFGVPPEWLDDVRQADEDSILEVAEHLPAEAAEAVLSLAVGEKPVVAPPVVAGSDPFAHPDAQRRFRVMENIEELQRALEFPWEKWSVFLHPAQRQLVEGDYSGPVRVAGSAGTGKTVVALHRAVFLARRHPEARVLLATFSDTLANALHNKLRCLISGEPRLAERLEVHSLDAIGQRLYTAQFEPARIVSAPELQKILREAAAAVNGHNFSLRLLQTEWEQVVDAWQLQTWEDYRDVLRLGRKARLSEGQRRVLWSVFEKVRATLAAQGLMTRADLFGRLAARFAESGQRPFDFIVMDEAQDISVAQLRFLAALGGNMANGLFFTGDLGQRIFQTPFSWKALGVEIRGRSHILRINYRTSHQIRTQADRLLGPEVADVDGNIEDRRGTISVFNGPQPVIEVVDSPEHEIETVAKWLKERSVEGIVPHEIGIFVRSKNEIDRAVSVVKQAGLPHIILDERVAPGSGHVAVSTMHLAKGLEFKAVAVMACDDEVIPLQERIETVADESDLEEVYTTERHLLYVACTRARDFLLVSGVEPASEFLDDLQKK